MSIVTRIRLLREAMLQTVDSMKAIEEAVMEFDKKASISHNVAEVLNSMIKDLMKNLIKKEKDV